MDVITRKIATSDLATLSRSIRDLGRSLDAIVDCMPDDYPLLKVAIATRQSKLDAIQNEVLRIRREIME
jgi:hypothetical protein